MKQLKVFILSLGIVVGLTASPVLAINVFEECPGGSDSQICASKDEEATDLVRTAIDVFLFALGITAVVLIIHSGLKFITSRGDPASVKSAKDTLLYAVTGLIVAILAFVIVNFVTASLG